MEIQAQETAVAVGFAARSDAARGWYGRAVEAWRGRFRNIYFVHTSNTNLCGMFLDRVADGDFFQNVKALVDRLRSLHAVPLRRCWRPALLARGLPAAIVLQDGATPDSVPWDELAAVFVGASTRWKLSRSAELLMRMARARGLWTHVGRVNTMGRLARVEAMGAHSFDGSQFSRCPERYLPRFLARLEHRQQPLPEITHALH